MVKMETDDSPSEASSIQVVLPGDSVKQVPVDAAIKLGPGVMQLSSTTTTPTTGSNNSVHISATRAGILGVQKASSGKKGAKSGAEMCWVEARSKRVGRYLYRQRARFAHSSKSSES